MKALLTVDDVAAVLQVSRRSAYTYMEQMPHMDQPRRVTERALQEWIDSKMVCPPRAAKVRKLRRVV